MSGRAKYIEWWAVENKPNMISMDLELILLKMCATLSYHEYRNY